jgi:thioredoxin reductase
MNVRDETLPVAVIGAGPVGLAAAAHLLDRGMPFEAYEAGACVGENLLSYAHVRLFSPWRFNVDPAAVKILRDEGWRSPEEDQLPTAGELVRNYLEPLAASKHLSGRIHLNAPVLAVSRARYDKVKSAGREYAPFVLQVQSNGTIEEHLASAVIDASGTWSLPNPLGANGLACMGEAENRDRITYGMPDILGSARSRYAGRKVLVVGAGHSAAGNLIALAELAAAAPETRIAWAVRGSDLRRIFGGGERDGLPARGALGLQLQWLVAEGRLVLHLGFHLRRIERAGDRLRVFTDDATTCVDEFDQIIAATGSRPDLAITRELRLRLDPWLESTEALAPLIDPNVHSCGTVPPHGHRELQHPESRFYAIGAKSYGRAPNFLMATGYEQARSVVAALAGDLAAADDVQLVLPQTGVCSSDWQIDSQDAAATACCAAEVKPAQSTCCAVEKPKEEPLTQASRCCGSPTASAKAITGAAIEVATGCRSR